MKQAEYKCQDCGTKQSMAKGKEVKLEVHHVNGIDNWEKIIQAVQQELLGGELRVLCKQCHEGVHGKKES